MFYLSPCLLLASGCTVAAVLDKRTDFGIPLQIPYSAPSNASPAIDSSFAAFAFEERSFYLYFGTPSNPNQLSLNFLNSIAEQTKTKPYIRVGGTSLDDSQYDPNQPKPVEIPKGEADNGIPSNMTFGPSFFDAFHRIPNAKYIIDIPMKKNNLNNSKIFAKDAVQKIGAENIVGLEIGNEPDNYALHVDDYVKRWKEWSSDILQTLRRDQNDKIYQAVCLGSQTGATKFPGGTDKDWKVGDAFKQGLKDVESRIKTVSMHYYQTKANEKSDLQHDIMNHTAVVRGSSFVKDAIKYLNKQTTPIPLVLGEVGSALGNKSDNSPLENVLGSALWQADFFLYSMSIGVKRIHLQSGLTFPFALWNPEFAIQNKVTPASVHAPFYGQIFAAAFRGDRENVRVRNFDLGRPFLSAYGAYDDGKLGRLALFNMNLWSRNENRTRPAERFSLDIGETAKSVVVQRLTSLEGGTAGVENITWTGMQWTPANNGKGSQVLNDTVTLPVVAGKVEVSANASEAVMVYIKS